jgi:hypothetical protein
MLDVVTLGFVLLATFIIALALDTPKHSAAKPSADTVLTVVGETKAGTKVNAGVFEFDRALLKLLAKSAEPSQDYIGPDVQSVLSRESIDYRTLLFYSAGSKKVQKMLQKDELGPWIVAISKKDKELTWANDGPFMLFNQKDDTQKVARLIRIEAK